MGASLATIEPYLKEVYSGKIRRQLNDAVTTLKRIERSSNGVTSETNGKYVTFPIHTQRNNGLGSRNEMDPLPVPGQQGYAAARLALKSAYGGFQITGQAIDQADSDPKAFARSIDEEIERLKNDVRKDMNRQVYGDGSGAVGTVTGANTGATVPVADARLFWRGMVLDSYTLPATKDNTALVVASVNVAAKTVTFTAAPGTALAANDILVRTGSFGKEITGFKAIVSDSTPVYNINPATEPEWTSEIDAPGADRALTEQLMVTMSDRIRTRGGKTTVIFQSLGVRRAYWNLLSQLRTIVNDTDFEGGFRGLSFTTDDGEIPVVADVDAPLGKQWFINEDAIKVYRDKDWDWMDRTGSMFQQLRDANGDYDAWYARLVERHELGTDRRNTHGLISNIIEG